MNYQEIVQKGELIYASQSHDSGFRKWSLLETYCKVGYYVIEPLDDIEYLICSIIDENEGSIDSDVLADILGFNLTCDFQQNPKRYKDEAEIEIFEGIVRRLEKWGLIKTVFEEKKLMNCTITELGKIALKKKEKYLFYSADIKLIENIDVRNDETALYFDFCHSLGWNAKIENVRKLSYDSIDLEIFHKEKTPLIKQIELQTIEKDYNFYYAEKTDDFEYKSGSVDIRLYKFKDEFYPIIFYDEQVSDQATKVINNNENKRIRKIEWGRWLSLKNDPKAILDYEIINEFEDIIDFDQLIEDPRLKWDDEKLFNLIAERVDATQWTGISQFCPFDVIKRHIEQYSEKWEWITLSQRAEDDFLLQNITNKKYQWNYESILLQEQRNIEILKKILLQTKLSELNLDWTEILPRLDDQFIVDNIDKVDFDLHLITSLKFDLCKSLICQFPCKSWNWVFVTNQYDLQFIYDNFNVFVDFLNLKSLLDRVFMNESTVDKFLELEPFHNIIRLKRNELYNVNNKNYVWTNRVITFFEQLELITWGSTNNLVGFECNDYLKWNDEDFFEQYHNKISTEKGYKHISCKITNSLIVTKYPDFNWDWTILSQNKSLLEDYQFVLDNRERFNCYYLISNVEGKVIDALLENANIVNFLNKNESLWTIVTEKASIDCVRKNIDYAWNWKILTKKFFSILKIESLGNEKWVDKWDWEYLTQNLPTEILKESNKIYQNHIDWNIFLSRLTSEDLLDNENKLLRDIAKHIANLDLTFKKQLWTKITQKFSFEQLNEMIQEDVSENLYQWDYSDFYSRREFELLSYIENYNNFVHWDELSCSKKLNDELRWYKNEESMSVWENRIINFLRNEQYHWNFKYLSHLESINSNVKVLKIRTALWDWEYLSQHSFNNNFQEISRNFGKFLNFEALTSNDGLMFEFDYVFKNKDKNWNWTQLTNKILKFDSEKFLELADKDWDWTVISTREEFDFNEKFIKKIKDKQIDWISVSRRKSFVATKQVLDILTQKKLDWDAISQKKLSSEVVATYKDKLNWNLFSENKDFELNFENLNQYKKNIDWVVVSRRKDLNLKDDVLVKFKDLLDWNEINKRNDFRITNEILESFYDKIDWCRASSSKDLNFSKELIDRYFEYWDWCLLTKNSKAREFLVYYPQQQNCVTFIEKFDGRNFIEILGSETPYICHFTHLYNAIEVIKSRKILSRNKAKGEFTSSAGGLVDRRNTAHKFARFYFRPKTPTQFYNECLGYDSKCGYWQTWTYYGQRHSKWKDYYPQALNMGLPKCPMPVFFIFDLKEVIRKIPSKCYYSTGNLQTDRAKVYKIMDNPNELNLTYLYSDPLKQKQIFPQYKEYSQQEFLVEDEFDFSTLESYKIVCYDQEQADILKKNIGEDTIVRKITTVDGGNIFHRNNRQLQFHETDTELRISSNYSDDAYFTIEGEIDNLKVINVEDVKKETNKEIILYPKLKIQKCSGKIEIYFVDERARTKKWLIYKS